LAVYTYIAEINLTGKTIGKYKIIERIGHGGMADVYKALHPELNRVVALKVLNRALVHSPEMLERFRREARAIAALRHPNIVQVFDLDVADGAYFMVMEYIEGETLSQRLTRLRRRGERLPLHEVLYIIAAVGKALHYAHEQGMLHRDVKPANVMFRGDGSVILTDFGVAKILDVASDITASGAVAGTPAYMAPEQWTNDEPDKRSDIYSLGIVLYQVVTGELPFNAETPGRLMFKHLSEPPPLPRKLCADIPLELERGILRALAKDPQDRYQTAQELVADLRDVIYQLESTAPTGIFDKPLRPLLGDRTVGPGLVKAKSLARRAPWFWFGAGVIVVLAAVIGLLTSGFIGSTALTTMPDVTGTAMAVRLATLEAALTTTPTPSPRPSATPEAPTWMPVPTEVPTIEVLSLRPSPSPTACVLAMTLLSDVNYFNPHWWGTVNASFNKTWQLRNDGDCPWPQGTVLVHLDGEAFGLDEPFEVGSLPAGEEMTLSVPLRVPSRTGQYEGRFQLQTPGGASIGEPLVVKIKARPRVSLTPAATPEPLRIQGWDLFEWRKVPARDAWVGKVRLWAHGGTGEYTWYRDTLDNPLPGDVLEFEWLVCGDFSGTVIVTSGDMQDQMGLYVPYPAPCQ
jgi:serine/threonine protein kinase